MSHYSQIKSIMKRKSSLIKALQKIDNGRWKNAVEVPEEATNLYGYQGDKREQKADIIIRRKHVGGSSNDIGFKQREDGTFEAIISDYDSSRHDSSWLDRLTQQYACETVKEVAYENGYSVTEEEVNGEIFLTCETAF